MIFITAASVSCNEKISSQLKYQSPEKSQHIIDGETLNQKHPLQSSVLNLQVTLKEYEIEVNYNCTATPISKRLILTAAHCFPQNTLRSKIIIKTQAGTTMTIPIKDYRNHKKYDIHTHDIAIAILQKDLPPSIIPVKLIEDINTLVNQDIIIAGYGLTENDPVINGFRRNKDLNDRLHFGPATLDTRTTYSLIFSEQSKSHSCFGDSGGPAFSKNASGEYIQIGISKYVINPDCEGEFHYEFILPHLEWIQESIVLWKL